MSELIDRDELIKEYDRVHVGPAGGARALMVEAPAVDAIPVSWIEAKIEWLKSLENSFSDMTALNIKVMVKQWREEQTGRKDD